MSGAAAVILGVSWPGALVPTLLGVAGLSLTFRRRLPRTLVWTAFVLTVSVAAALELVRRWPTSSGAAQDVARVCGALALLWSVCAAVVLHRRGGPALPATRHASFVGIAYVVALLLAVVVAVIQSVVLVMRMVYIAIDLVNGYPYIGYRAYGFGPEGLWSLGFLFAACAVSLISTRDRRLGTCQLWCAVMTATWASLLTPVLRSTVTGGDSRTGTPLVLLLAFSFVITTAVAIREWVERPWRRTAFTEGEELAVTPRPWPGFSLSITIIAVTVIFLTFYHLVVPIVLVPKGFRLSVLVVTISAVLTALACFLLFVSTRRVHLAQVAMGLTSFAICGLATLAVPSKPVALDERYPLLFNAMIVGFASATALWTWLASVWGQQSDEGRAWPTTDRLIPHTKRFAFLNATLAVLVSAVMALWPRWSTIATMDDSLGRVSAGLSANLLLLLVVLWSSHRLRRFPFQILTVLIVVSTAVFLMIRILPSTPRYG